MRRASGAPASIAAERSSGSGGRPHSGSRVRLRVTCAVDDRAGRRSALLQAA